MKSADQREEISNIFHEMKRDHMFWSFSIVYDYKCTDAFFALKRKYKGMLLK